MIYANIFVIFTSQIYIKNLPTYLYEQALWLVNYRNLVSKERIINTDHYCLKKANHKMCSY